jgi:uncharacterized protein
VADDTESIIPRRARVQLDEALADTPIVAINGPRQVGKSTLAVELLRRHGGVMVTLDDETQRLAALDDARGFAERDSRGGPFIIDEVQLAPSLFRALKASVDRDRRPGRFVLTGSTRLLSAAGFADAFVGRIEVVELWPLSQGELTGSGDHFVDWAFSENHSLEPQADLRRVDYATFLARGGFPEAVRREGSRRRRWFDNYLTTLVDQVVRQVSAIERISEIPRVIRLCAARSGEELNVTRLADDLRLPPRTLDGYLALLANVFVLQLIPAWSTNLSKKVIRRPKLVMVDSGLASHLAGMHPDRIDDPGSPFGPLLEAFVAMELRKQLSWSDAGAQLFHFRDRDGAEVDLVLEHPDGRVVGIEVKAARSVSSHDTRGLRFLADRLGERFHAGFVLSCMPEVVSLGQAIIAAPIQTLWSATPPS